MRGVTAAGLRAAGFDSFGWVHPSERLEGGTLGSDAADLYSHGGLRLCPAVRGRCIGVGSWCCRRWRAHWWHQCRQLCDCCWECGGQRRQWATARSVTRGVPLRRREIFYVLLPVDDSEARAAAGTIGLLDSSVRDGVIRPVGCRQIGQEAGGSAPGRSGSERATKPGTGAERAGGALGAGVGRQGACSPALAGEHAREREP